MNDDGQSHLAAHGEPGAGDDPGGDGKTHLAAHGKARAGYDPEEVMDGPTLLLMERQEQGMIQRR